MAVAAIPITVATGRPSEGGHWYNRSGRMVYEVAMPGGGMRAATLRDARKLNLVPGVSGILRMEAAPGLERWKIRQMGLACLTLPREPGENEDQFLARAWEDAMAQAAKARERGTAIHAAIQSFFEGKPVNNEWWPYIEPVKTELTFRFGVHAKWESEQSFAHHSGYGGKADLLCRNPVVIADIKTTEFDKEDLPKDLAWPEHVAQLAAYARGHFNDHRVPTVLNIYVSTTQLGLVRIRQWEPDEVEEAAQAFDCLLKLWKLRRKYDGSW